MVERMYLHSLDLHERTSNLEEVVGSKRGSFWVKQSVQGLHCIHIRSLPVSIIPTKLVGGLPIDTFIGYSPLL